MEEIKIGEYIRKNGKIGKVVKINYKNPIYKYEYTKYLIKWQNKKEYFITKIKNIKHSKNLIDILEKGDFVNKHLVVSIKNDEERTELGLESDIILNKYIEDNEIINVLTHEQYEQNCYNIKEEN